MNHPNIRPERIHHIRDDRSSGSDQTLPGDRVVYWMQHSQRAEENHALEYSILEANRLSLPLVCIFSIDPEYPQATQRSFRFMLEGLAETQDRLGERKIPLSIAVGDPSRIIPRWCEDAALLVCDRGYLRHERTWRRDAADQLACPVVEVESDVIVPVRAASVKEEWSAATLRKKITPQIPGFLQPLPPGTLTHPLDERDRSDLLRSGLGGPGIGGTGAERSDARRSGVGGPGVWGTGAERSDTKRSDVGGPGAERSGARRSDSREYDIGMSGTRGSGIDQPDATAAWIDRVLAEIGQAGYPEPLVARGGRSWAMQRLSSFLAQPRHLYKTARNDPGREVTSGLSPYLHFGQISPGEVARTAAGLDGFLEELMVRRELAVNFVWYNDAYDHLSCLPAWAATTLAEHADDQREYTYSYDELRRANTHDPYWNAAQNEMLVCGRMHNYMRMYWGKKILEWSETPETGYHHAVLLNDTYELDGRDPNGYAGVAWCFGKHDRAWKERPIFGKVRYMNANGLKRKGDIEGYVRRVEGYVARVEE